MPKSSRSYGSILSSETNTSTRMARGSIYFDDEVHDANTGETSLYNNLPPSDPNQTFGPAVFSKRLTQKASVMMWKPEYINTVVARRATCGQIVELMKQRDFHARRDVADAGEFTTASEKEFIVRKYMKRRHSHLGVRENNHVPYVYTLPGIHFYSDLEHVKGAFKHYFGKKHEFKYENTLKATCSNKQKGGHEPHFKFDMQKMEDKSTNQDTESISLTTAFGPPLFASSLQSKSSRFSWRFDFSESYSRRSSCGDILSLLLSKGFHMRRNVSDTNEFTLAFNAQNNQIQCKKRRHSHVGEIGARNYDSEYKKTTIAGISRKESLLEIINSMKKHYSGGLDRKRTNSKETKSSRNLNNNV